MNIEFVDDFPETPSTKVILKKESLRSVSIKKIRAVRAKVKVAPPRIEYIGSSTSFSYTCPHCSHSTVRCFNKEGALRTLLGHIVLLHKEL